jgi:hypothetical protein
MAPKITVARFEALDFDPDRFDHESHVYIARELILEFGQEVAAERFARTLKTLTDKLGVPGKYHETITRFYVHAIAERSRLAAGADWESFRTGHPELFDGSLLRSSYSAERLASDEARRFFVLPDKSKVA